MLSIEDFYKEIGRNIYIYPLKDIRMLGNSIDLTASKYAWTADGKFIFDEKQNAIIVPSHTTACILTQEAIYVTSKIGGTYHSRVTLVKRGFCHIGTMLDPEYIGQSLIVLHNTTDKEKRIDYKERIVSLVFYYLHTPILTQSHNASPGHREKLAGFEKIDKYLQWCEVNRWAFEKRELVDKFMESDDYRQLTERRRTDQENWNSRWKLILKYFLKYLLKYGTLIIICVILYFFLKMFLGEVGTSDKISLIGVLLAGIVGCIGSDLTRR